MIDWVIRLTVSEMHYICLPVTGESQTSGAAGRVVRTVPMTHSFINDNPYMLLNLHNVTEL